MLSGKKPLSMFYAEIGELPDEVFIPESTFAPYLEAGRFVRDETQLTLAFHPTLQRHVQLKYVFFALASEAWRIPAAILLLHSSLKVPGPRQESAERMMSALLGYTEEQIDAWCDSQYRSSRIKDAP